MSVSIGNLGSICHLVARSALPPFQRGYVWTPAQAELLLDSITRGFPIGAILVWDPSVRNSRIWPADSGMILDGQQRLTALTGMRPGGERVHSVAWHFEESRWRVYAGTPDAVPDGAWPIEADAMDQIDALRSGRFPRTAERAYCKAYDALRFSSQIPIHCVQGTAEDALEAFRRVNAGGTPIPSADLATLLRCAA